MNLHSYVELTLKYILLFKTPSNGQHDDYMIFEDLEYTGIKSFLETLCDTMRSNMEHCFRKMKSTSEHTNYSTMHLIKNLYSKNIKGKSYKDIIREECETEFIIINVPFSKATFTKIYQLKTNHNTIFTNDEFSVIFFHIFNHEDWLPSLTRTMCYHLQNNPTFIQEIYEIAHNSDQTNNDQQKKCLSTLIDSQSNNAKIFKRMVNSSITLLLKDNKGRVARTNRNSTRFSYISHEIKLEELNVAFLIESLNMSFEYFISNHDILCEKFCNTMVKSSLAIKIHTITDQNDCARFDLVSETEILSRKLALITESRLFKDDCVHEVILQFNNITIPLDKTIVYDVKKISTIICTYTSFDFVESVPKEIETLEIVLADKILGSNLNIPYNVKTVSFLRSHFYEDIIFPSHVRSVEIIKSEVNPNTTIIFDENCENISICDTQVKVKLFEFSKLNYILLENKISRSVNLKYQKRNNLENGLLKLIGANLCGVLRLNDNFQEVEFSSVNLEPNSKVILDDHKKFFSIFYSTGLFDLSSFIGISLNFTNRMQINTEPSKNSSLNLLNLFIKNMKLSENMVLSDYFECLKLENVTMLNSTKVVLNSSCRTIILEDFQGTIDVSNVPCFEKIEIYFQGKQKTNISFHEAINTHHLCLNDAHKDVEAIKSMFSTLKRVDHLKFKSEYTYKCTLSSSGYIETLESIPGYQAIAEKYFSDLKQNRSLEYQFREPLFYETCSAVFNAILESILNVSVAKTIRNIEFESVKLSKHNYKILTNLESLTVLDLGTKSITDTLFGCLPPNLKLLSIAGPSKYEKSEGTKYNLVKLQRIAKLSDLKVLIIDADLIFKIRTLSFIPSSVEVLEIYFESIPEKLPVLTEPLLHLRELYVKGNNLYEDRYSRRMNIINTMPFVNFLRNCIDFESLEQFFFVSPYVLTKIDSRTLEFIETRSGKFYERFGPIYDEVDRS